MKQAREQELKYLRELGVYDEKVDDHAVVAKCNVTPIDTKWVDTDKAFEVEPMQIRSRIVPREFKRGDRPNLPLKALKAIISTGASQCAEFSLMPVDVSRACFHAITGKELHWQVAKQAREQDISEKRKETRRGGGCTKFGGLWGKWENGSSFGE